MFSTLFPYLLLMYSFIFKIVCFFISYFVYIFCNSSYFVYIFCNSLMNIMRTFYFVRGTVEIYLYFLFPKIITSIYLNTHTFYFFVFRFCFPCSCQSQTLPLPGQMYPQVQGDLNPGQVVPMMVQQPMLPAAAQCYDPSAGQQQQQQEQGILRRVKEGILDQLHPPSTASTVCSQNWFFHTNDIVWCRVWWLYQRWYDAMICCSQDTNVRCKPLHPQVN